jgi:uncharacterized protein YlxW (UPF0749 family)
MKPAYCLLCNFCVCDIFLSLFGVICVLLIVAKKKQASEKAERKRSKLKEKSEKKQSQKKAMKRRNKTSRVSRDVGSSKTEEERKDPPLPVAVELK